MSGRPLAVLDANVLYPFQTRNFLLHLAASDLFDPLWSEGIVREMGRNLVSDGAVNRDQLRHLVGEMQRHFPEAWGHGYEGRADHLTVPDESDRHVIALALHYEAEYVITHNKKDFPEAVLDPIGLQALDPDEFVTRTWTHDLENVVRAAEAHRVSLTKSPLEPEDYLRSLARPDVLPQTSARLKAAGFLDRRPVLR